MDPIAAMWDDLAVRATTRIDKYDYMSRLPQICVPKARPEEDPLANMEMFEGPGPWDRDLLDVEIENPLAGVVEGEPERKKVLIFSGNDYLNLSSHPAVRKAAAKAAMVHGMGPRASSMISGHSDYHRLLEDTLAELTKKEACVVTTTGFAANTAFFAALGSIASLTCAGKRPEKHEKIAIFSDALNHASIIDGLRLVERQREADIVVFRHNDMKQLDELLTNCKVDKKVVCVDSLFSMEGDFAPMMELVDLRKKHGFLFVIDDAHTTLVCGKDGGGIAEVYGIEDQIDICVGTLSKGPGTLGGFISCSKKWKKLIQGRGRSYIFTTATPLPVIAASYASIMVAKKEAWRRQALWNNVRQFTAMTKHPATSPIMSLVVGTEDAALRASKHMLDSGFHVTAIRPPAVPAHACRLRVTLTACHSSDDLRRLVAALSQCIPSLQKNAEQLAAKI